MTKTDKLIFWGVLAGSCLLLLFSNEIFAGSGEKRVIVEVNGAPYAEYALSGITEPKILNIQTESGGLAIAITKDAATILSSSCSDGLCLGEIKNPGEMLVCLPNKAVVRMAANGEVDRVAY